MSEDQTQYGQAQEPAIDLESRVLAQQEIVSSLYARIIQGERTLIRRIDEQSTRLMQAIEQKVEQRVNKLSDDLAGHFEWQTTIVATKQDVKQIQEQLSELREEMSERHDQLQNTMQQIMTLIQGKQP